MMFIFFVNILFRSDFMRKSKSLLMTVIKAAIVINSCLGTIHPVFNQNVVNAMFTPGIDLTYAYNLLSRIADDINNAGGWINVNGGILDMLQEPVPVPCRYRYVYVSENEFNYLSRAFKESIGFNPESFVRNPNYYVDAAKNLPYYTPVTPPPQYIPPSTSVQKKYTYNYSPPTYIPPSPYVQKKYYNDVWWKM